jgi:hypothetical protein
LFLRSGFGGDGNGDGEVLQWRHWSCVDLGRFVLDDSEVACRITRGVWHEGISDEAVRARGELWWGNPSVWERGLRLSDWSWDFGESVLSEVEVEVDGTGDDGIEDQVSCWACCIYYSLSLQLMLIDILCIG